MDPIIAAAGAALVSAMATDGWQQARASMVSLWRRLRPDEVEQVDADLVKLHAELVAAAQQANEDGAEAALTGSWQMRLQALIRADPAAAAELRQVLDEELVPKLAADDQHRVRSVVMNASATGQGRIYQSGRDQHITE